MKRTLKIIRISLAIILIMVVVFFDTVDYSPYRESAYYKETINRVSSLHPADSCHGTLKVGWAKANIIPSFPVKSVGYNKNALYTDIRDSLNVRVMVFSDQSKTIGLVSYDLIMVHPEVVKSVKSGLAETGVDEVYFAATHTHNGFGGWSPGLASRFILGGFEQRVVDWLGQQTRHALAMATAKSAPATVAYHQIALPDYVANRVNKVDGTTDDWFRMIKITTDRGEKALVSTFSAHATSLPRKLTVLSGDYPGLFNRNIETNDSIDFSLFCAGGVASHKPVIPDYTYEHMEAYAQRLSDTVVAELQNFNVQRVTSLDYDEIEVDVREATLKITQEVKLRSWLFESIMGEINPKLTYFQLGKIALIGAPADFSGELTPLIHKQVKKTGILPVVTSFNGAYMGYITKDAYYNRDYFETQEMNWFGPYNGAYFTELMARTITTKNPVD